MPLYDYRCSDCNHEIEVLQKIADDVLTTCPACAKETLQKCLSAPQFRLAGGGWYETDEKPKSQQRNIANASDSSGE